MKTIFSGIQASGELHLGNYLGAISQWKQMQDEYNCIFCVVDYHTITVQQDPKKLYQKIINIAKAYLASGIDPQKSIIFQQSHIKEHTELGWILNCITRMSDLEKMTQFKDKAKSRQENVSIGLYDYPVLMAGDILLYNTDIVPVGDDQAQHVELTRTLARRFNKQFGETFQVPELMIRKQGARIMGLDDPIKKMSKSASSELNYIALTDSPEIAKKKIMRAVTDSDQKIKFDQNKKPAIANLLTIYSLLSNQTIPDLEQKYQNSGYGEFKKDLAEVISDFLINWQKKYFQISDEEIEKILINGAKKAQPIAQKTIQKAKEKIGLRKQTL